MFLLNFLAQQPSNTYTKTTNAWTIIAPILIFVLPLIILIVVALIIEKKSEKTSQEPKPNKEKEETTSLFCQNCGKELSKDSLYCNFCGTKQTNIESTNNPSTKEEDCTPIKESESQESKSEESIKQEIKPSPQNKNFSEQKKHTNYILIAIVLFFALLIAIALGAGNCNTNNNDNSLFYRSATIEDIDTDIIEVPHILQSSDYTLVLQANEKIEGLKLTVNYYSNSNTKLASKTIYIGTVAPGNRYTYDVTYDSIHPGDIDKVSKFSVVVVSGKVKR